MYIYFVIAGKCIFLVTIYVSINLLSGYSVVQNFYNIKVMILTKNCYHRLELDKIIQMYRFVIKCLCVEKRLYSSIQMDWLL